jgi:hypothetical protein
MTPAPSRFRWILLLGAAVLAVGGTVLFVAGDSRHPTLQHVGLAAFAVAAVVYVGARLAMIRQDRGR